MTLRKIFTVCAIVAGLGLSGERVQAQCPPIAVCAIRPMPVIQPVQPICRLPAPINTRISVPVIPSAPRPCYPAQAAPARPATPVIRR